MCADEGSFQGGSMVLYAAERKHGLPAFCDNRLEEGWRRMSAIFGHKKQEAREGDIRSSATRYCRSIQTGVGCSHYGLKGGETQFGGG